MKSIVSIHQPNYIPWIGYFYKIYKSDIFVLLDDVQFSNQGAHNYHYLKTPQGIQRIKIPVKHAFGAKIKEVYINDKSDWRKKHLEAFYFNYKKAPFFEEVFSDLKRLYEYDTDSMSDFNSNIIKFLIKKFNFETRLCLSSSLEIISMKEEKVIDICKSLNADIYLSGTGAKVYQDPENFANAGLELEYIAFSPRAYKQLWGDFEHNVNIFDFVMNHGYDWNLIKQAQK